MASSALAPVSHRKWPHINRAMLIFLVVINLIAVIEIGVIAEVMRCSSSLSCGPSLYQVPYNWTDQIKYDLLLTNLVASKVVLATGIIDGLMAFYMVGTRLGLGEPKARRITGLVLSGIVLISIVAKLLYLI